MVAICLGNVKFFSAAPCCLEAKDAAGSAGRIQEHVAGTCSSLRYKRLMPLIASGIKANCQQCPQNMSTNRHGPELASDRAANQKGKDEIFTQMPELAD